MPEFECVVADEPTGEVDNKTGELIINLMLRTVNDTDTALIITTHGHFPYTKTDRVMELNDGIVTDFSFTCNEFT